MLKSEINLIKLLFVGLLGAHIALLEKMQVTNQILSLSTLKIRERNNVLILKKYPFDEHLS